MTGKRFYNIMMWLISLLGVGTGWVGVILHASDSNLWGVAASGIGLLMAGFGAINFTDRVLENER